jgi:hypothetical protein
MQGFRIPPGGQLTVEIESAAVLQDPGGGPPIEVSSRLLPDPLAIYFHALAVVAATRAVQRLARWQKITGIAFCVLMVSGALNLAWAIWAIYR